MRYLQLLGSSSIVAAMFVGCTEDSTSQSSPASIDLPDGSAPDSSSSGGPDGSSTTPDGAADDGSTASGCSIPGDNYAIYGAQLFKVSEDLKKSVLVAKVANQNGLPFGSAGTNTTGAQVGSTLVVSDANCPFCSIALPPVIVDGTVKAEPITTGITTARYFYSPGIPNKVVLWGIGTTFTQYDLAQKKEDATAGVLISGPGVNCNKLYAIKGSITPTSYSVRILAECGDGSGPTWATIADTSGTKVGSNWQQDSFQTVASAQGMAQNPQIQVGDLTRNIFIGSANKIYKQNAGTFELDTTTVYQQCNALTGMSVPGARPLIPAPKG